MYNENKANLDEVSFIRPILIVLLILVHCFTVYNGGWPPFPGFNECTTYKWLSRTAYSFMLETFIFISGYVWGFQVIGLKKSISLQSLIKTKFERLIIPSIAFSILYIVLLGHINTTNMGGGKIILSIISGVGHLWYLPVLFWCFIAMWLIERFKIRDTNKFLFVLMFAMFPYPYLPFQLSRMPYYLLFFFIGYKTWQHKDKLSNGINLRKVLILWGVYLICFMILRNTKVYLAELMDNVQLWEKVIYKIASAACQIGYSSIGTIAFYLTAILFTKRYNLKQWYINLGGLCFGVYIFQEFIIKYLYYYTELPSAIGFILLPWITFFITFIMALLLAKATKSL